MNLKTLLPLFTVEMTAERENNKKGENVDAESRKWNGWNVETTNLSALSTAHQDN